VIVQSWTELHIYRPSRTTLNGFGIRNFQKFSRDCCCKAGKSHLKNVCKNFVHQYPFHNARIISCNNPASEKHLELFAIFFPFGIHRAITKALGEISILRRALASRTQ
jgi:hypothetical protein